MQPLSLTIRHAGPADADAIARLAQLDAKRIPSGEVLVALSGDAPIAALAVDDGLAIGDPFSLSSEAVELLRLRAAQQHETLRRSRLRGLRRSASRRLAQAR
ncbi:MAG TPA: hypothetical protein VK304_13560 [Thermoleophilaceae bacterium]|nr:hypothetical protein [Thermoleophilaceae bacterium]